MGLCAGISHCLGAALFAKGDLSKPWDTTALAADTSLSVMGVAALAAPSTMFKSVGSISERWQFKVPMLATSKPSSSLDVEIGPSDLDLLNLMDYQALCLGTRIVFPDIPVELYAAKDWRVLCARRWKRPERIMGLECEAALWARRTIRRKSQSREDQHLILSNSTSGYGHLLKAVDRRARELCGLCLASNVSVRYRWFPSERNPADEPLRRFECSLQYSARFRETSNSRLPRQCWFLDEFDASGAVSHAVKRVETEKNLRVLLGPAAAEASQKQQRAANRSVKASTLPPGFAFDFDGH